MNRSLVNRLITVVVVLLVAVYHLHPLEKAINLGLDLRGGTSYTLQLDLPPSMSDYEKANAVDKTMEILRKRIDTYGLREPILQPVGKDRVVVQIAGLDAKDKESARSQLEKVAFLELRMVHPRNQEELAKIESRGGQPPPGYEVLELVEKRPGRGEEKERILVKKKPDLTGKQLTTAFVRHDPSGFKVAFELNAEGSKLFEKLTRENIGNRLAIVLDGKPISAPRIQSEISGHGEITGDFDQRAAFDLATALQNPLSNPVKIIEERGVDPSLGADSIRSGISAGIIGLGSVVLFMLIYYLRAGFIANLALAINILLLMGILAIFKFTLTLPGIAGIILTVGIAVDANVLIYERIREELKKGKPLFAAVDAGFSRAFTTIIDANVTTLITALVLAKLGTGPVQGFGVTLSAGIVTSVFSAVVVSRLVFDLLLKNPNFKQLTMLSLVRQTRFNFLGFKWPAIALSGTLIVGGAIFTAKNRDHIYGVDFAGGDSLTLKSIQKVDVSDIRKALESIGIKESFIQYQREVQSQNEVLTLKVPYEKGKEVETTLKSTFPKAEFALLQMDQVGPAVGKELQWAALKGLLVAAGCILIYITIRFEFAYAVGAIIALFHDVAICLAFFFFTDRQLSLPVIGALLTIAGYSLNDTIVVFDRIREELRLKGERFGYEQLINLSVNETLSRTLLTSLTTLLASLALYVFGGGVINDFAFVLVVGVITGTYSSVFIAGPVLLLWHPSKLSPQEVEKSSSIPTITSAP